MKTKEYYYEQECRNICEAIQDIDFGDEDFQPTMNEMVTTVQQKIGYPIVTRKVVNNAICCFKSKRYACDF